ncbi:MAG: hypothetical protein DWQ35_19995 [Planctomycetota bacterium]|nr:MAG: hypothetical protein DWQ35_19995 [Planctomycetota bacterium]REK28394.1 MAG: hypothetical protein DWQ42_05305 [Planctomycetota bacterium]REK48410.1 MAG: hypothetical protein DWQ46_02455 [Planctomycetota bacterium]
MEVEKFLELAERLTGTPVKPLGDNERTFLARVLRDDGKRVDCTQMNELLLLVNKDRMDAPFFEAFFTRPSVFAISEHSDCTIAEIETGVERFQKVAMLCFGNFVFAYRTLSRIQTEEDLQRELADVWQDPEVLLAELTSRSPKILEIDPISRDDTFLVGYLSARQISEDKTYADLLRAVAEAVSGEGEQWEEVLKQIDRSSQPNDRPKIRSLVENHRKRHSKHSVAEFARVLSDDVLPALRDQLEMLGTVQAKATGNQDIYLTWDHMDVYFATSMRKRWEYQDLYTFVNELMGRPEVAELNLRYFDPTQSFTANRVNKGLVEALMLRRAKCTVYSVQDTDTLGKDSELAATLAQGKPVIAYIPDIDVEQRAQELIGEDPVTVQERLRFLLHADESFVSSLGLTDRTFVEDFAALGEFERDRVWKSLPDEEAIRRLRDDHQEEISQLCRLLAVSEKRLYDGRARTLAQVHPLGIQVNLETGVANGVIVVRNVVDCATVLRKVVTNSLEFDLVDDKRDGMWFLKERVSGSVYRVVTKDRKLTNCFWNFYRRQ